MSELELQTLEQQQKKYLKLHLAHGPKFFKLGN